MKFKDVKEGEVVKIGQYKVQKVKLFVRKGSPYNVVSNDGAKNVFGFIKDNEEVER